MSFSTTIRARTLSPSKSAEYCIRLGVSSPRAATRKVAISSVVVVMLSIIRHAANVRNGSKTVIRKNRCPTARVRDPSWWVTTRLALTVPRHPGLEPGSRFFSRRQKGRSGMPDRVRHDEALRAARRRPIPARHRRGIVASEPRPSSASVAHLSRRRRVPAAFPALPGRIRSESAFTPSPPSTSPAVPSPRHWPPPPHPLWTRR